MKVTVLLMCCVAFAAGALAEVVTFQQGDANAYAGTVDTCFQKADSNDRSADSEVWTDGTGGYYLSRQGIIRFENLFASAGGPIPDGATINSATLSVWIFNPGSGAKIHRMLVNWASTANWNSLDSTNYPGVDNGWGCAQADTDPGDDAGVEYVATLDDTHDPIVTGSPIDWDVTPSVVYWSANPGENWGWVFTILGGSNWAFYSAEYSTQTSRPLLTIDYLAGTNIGAFSVRDQTSGSTAYTDSATVDVSMTVVGGPGATVTGYMITETATEPGLGDAGWLGVAPTSYTITGAQGTLTLYAWVKDDGGAVAGKSVSIYYSTATPGISNIVIDANYLSATISWQTDAPALGWLEYGLSGGALTEVTDMTALGTEHSVTLEGLAVATAYDYQIHSDGSVTALTAFSTLDAGAFYVAFLDEDTSGGAVPILVGGYDVNGGMVKPTFASNISFGGARGAAANPPGNGFATTYGSFFAHSGTDEARMDLEPPGGVLDPIAGTDSNPAGARLWVFSCLVGTDSVMPHDTSEWPKQPGVRLHTNRGSDVMEDILKVRFSDGDIMLDHAGGALMLVEGYAARTAYLVEVIFDVDADVFRVKVEGAYLPGDFIPLTGATAKGVGGFTVRGSVPVGVIWQELVYADELSLRAEPFTNIIENFRVTDATSGSPTATNDTTVDLAFDLFGPGYTHHIIEAGDSPTPPADENDGRWAAGAAPATVDLGSPSGGDTVTVTMWLLDADSGIQSAAASILYVTGNPASATSQRRRALAKPPSRGILPFPQAAACSTALQRGRPTILQATTKRAWEPPTALPSLISCPARSTTLPWKAMRY